MAGSFNRLPLEVLVNILSYAPDLPTIYKFICASSHANAAFNIDSPSILDSAIERSIFEFKHSARMIAILGTFAAKPNLSFKDLVDRYKDLPKDILSTAPASYAFVKGTPGPSYLVLTAYRIEVLQYLCFISMLQNIHEVMWSTTSSDKEETFHYPIKQSSRTGIPFQAAAWWAPSWVEKMRIMCAYWNLFVYWNIQTISPDLTAIMDDWKFSIYRTALRSIDPRVGPSYNRSNSESYDLYELHEIEEMKCVLVVTRDLFGFSLDSSSSFSPFTARRWDYLRLQLEKWTFTANFRESLNWRLEQTKSLTVPGSSNVYQDKSYLNKTNFWLRKKLWHCWYRDCSEKFGDQFLPPDYLGLCIWDEQRLGYLGLMKAPGNLLIRVGVL